jgi:hypothetical protein
MKAEDKNKQQVLGYMWAIMSRVMDKIDRDIKAGRRLFVHDGLEKCYKGIKRGIEIEKYRDDSDACYGVIRWVIRVGDKYFEYGDFKDCTADYKVLRGLIKRVGG